MRFSPASLLVLGCLTLSAVATPIGNHNITFDVSPPNQPSKEVAHVEGCECVAGIKLSPRGKTEESSGAKAAKADPEAVSRLYNECQFVERRLKAISSQAMQGMPKISREIRRFTDKAHEMFGLARFGPKEDRFPLLAPWDLQWDWTVEHLKDLGSDDITTLNVAVEAVKSSMRDEWFY